MQSRRLTETMKTARSTGYIVSGRRELRDWYRGWCWSRCIPSLEILRRHGRAEIWIDVEPALRRFTKPGMQQMREFLHEKLGRWLSGEGGYVCWHWYRVPLEFALAIAPEILAHIPDWTEDDAVLSKTPADAA